MTEQTPEQKEIEALRAHNTELLADLKKAKAGTKDAQAQVEALTAERDEARAQAKAVTLDAPVMQMAERVSVSPDLFLTAFGRHYQFTHDGEAVAIHDKDGNPATLKNDKGEARPATFTEEDVRALCDVADKATFDHLIVGSRATGGGAMGSRGGNPAPAKPAPTPKPAPMAFGLS